VQAYLEHFQNIVNVIEHCGGHLGHDPGLVNLFTPVPVPPKSKASVEPIPMVSKESTEDMHKRAQDHYLATAYILGADKMRYGRFLDSLENDYLQGRKSYPVTVPGECNLLTNWKENTSPPTRPVVFPHEAVAFATVTDDKRSVPSKDCSLVVCHKCNKKGHYANECPSSKTDLPRSHGTNMFITKLAPAAGEFHFHQDGNANGQVPIHGSSLTTSQHS
jgi:Zinc knuckle